MYRQRKQTTLKGRYCMDCAVFYPSHQTGHITDCPKCFKPLKKTAARPKYGNMKAEFRGKMVDSKKERDQVVEVDYLHKAKKIKSYETQVPFPMYVNGDLICTYYADIVIDHLDGTKEIQEVKSYITDKSPVWRLKRKLLETLYIKNNPLLNLTVLK